MLKSVAISFLAVCCIFPARILGAADQPDVITKMGFSVWMGIGKVAYTVPTNDARFSRIIVIGESTDRFPGNNPQFTADGNGIVYTDRPAKEQNIGPYFRDLTEGKTTKIKISTSNGYSPSLSPDGTQLVFEFYHGDSGRSDIYVRRSEPYSFEDEVVCQRLTTDHDNDTPRWSPDGTQILFLSERGAKSQVFVMDEDGGNQTGLTDGRDRAFGPVWSPDGEHIAYSLHFPTNNDNRNRGEIWVMKRDGTEKQKLSSAAADDYSPVWSPDGNRIIFQRRNLQNNKENTWIISPDGTGENQLTRNNRRISFSVLFKSQD